MHGSKVRDALRRRGIEPEATADRPYQLTETEIALACEQPLGAAAWDQWGTPGEIETVRRVRQAVDSEE